MNLSDNDLDNGTPEKLLNFKLSRRVPMVMQSEVSECGLASIAMISSYHGNQVNLAALRSKFKIDGNGMSLKQVIELCDDMGLAGRALKCPLEQISQLSLPCILHWDLNHFVVLTSVSRDGIQINDPAIGRRTLTYEQVSASYTGIALELNVTANFKKRNQVRTISPSQLWSKVTGLKSVLFNLVCLTSVLQIVSLISPYYMQWVIDSVLVTNDSSLLLILAFAFGLLMCFKVLIGALRSWVTIRLSSALNLQMGLNLFNHLLNLPLDFFEKRHVGDIVSRFDSMSEIREMITNGFIEAIIDGFTVILILGMMFLYSVELTLISLVLVLTSSLVQWIFYNPSKNATEEMIVSEAKEKSLFLETVRSMQTLKVFSQENNRKSLWLNRYADVINGEIKLAKINIKEDIINKLIIGIGGITSIYFAATFVISGDLTIGMMIAFIAYQKHFLDSAEGLVDNILSFKMMGLHLERVSDIALEKNELDSSSKLCPVQIDNFKSLELKNVSFRYSDSSDYIFNNINLTILAGESIALVGPSGCGKTTLLKVILGLLKPTSGRILINGVDADKIGIKQYRSFFGSVMQDDNLLSGTIVENITLFDSLYDEEFLYQCAKNAAIHDDIIKLPMGYHSLVGDMGSVFSGGQKQRIYLARAIYREPDILCLDESTSHLDGELIQLVDESVSKLKMTRIIIAHREETINIADRVVDLDQINLVKDVTCY
ncbi:peptidase domain-containing ABC transporter [Vibrio neptunius]|uniref:peptidase domain-containing ABC transporter n=1 Tax=Vibrio neptunius TaxID=170651 RepID=UPI0033159B5E